MTVKFNSPATSLVAKFVQMFCSIFIFGGLLIIMGQHTRFGIAVLLLPLEDHVPENHLLRLVDQHISFAFEREKLKDSYIDTGRPSIDPELLARQMVSYLQKAFGCAATRKPEKLLFVLNGDGNNGKTMLLEVIRDAPGGQGICWTGPGRQPDDSLKGGAVEQRVNTDLADLQGCRFVSSSEVEQGQRLSQSRVKYLTGLGQIKARRLRENKTTFRPTSVER